MGYELGTMGEELYHSHGGDFEDSCFGDLDLSPWNRYICLDSSKSQTSGPRFGKEQYALAE